ncbi:MAG TPA: amidohydrolase family protein, partial [Polyangia bacterium]|nr:amidohydrolase family protein [Polyangia bacterium]
MTAFTVMGRVLVGGRLETGAVVVDGGTIAAVLPQAALAAATLPQPVVRANVVSPGLIDLQINGGFGFDLGDSDEALRELAARLPATGVTAFLPTLVSRDPAAYRAAREVFASSASARSATGARALGLHLEGPFISLKRAGAHEHEPIRSAADALIDDILRGDDIRLVTLAPERPGALQAIARLRAHGVVVSLGHTDATFDQFVAGIDAGATMATHLYNAMSPFAHRAPGAVGAVLTDDRIVAGVIADGVHAHYAALNLALKAKGAAGVAL